ncbi:hypothetical protein [Henriciella litoralis]|uniref:hypothetical protein n=1 Tax=Henriciella litoralis TaxID=568102 RepID=UPI00111BD1B2|nr:hypothetical protein [Henriciella litoralis]
MTHSAEPHLNDMRTRALVLLAALVQQLRALLPNGAPLPKSLRCLILRLLCPAEALMRRVIALAAAEIELAGEAAATDAATAKKPASENTATSIKKSSFTLFEARPGLNGALNGARPAFGPGPRILDLSKPYPGSTRQSDKAGSPIALRIAGLAAAVENPERLARRLARLRARRLSTSKRVSSRLICLSPLRPGWPPGARRKDLPDELSACLSTLSIPARNAMIVRDGPGAGALGMR